jgi:hypothetical protein
MQLLLVTELPSVSVVSSAIDEVRESMAKFRRDD